MTRPLSTSCRAVNHPAAIAPAWTRTPSAISPAITRYVCFTVSSSDSPPDGPSRPVSTRDVLHPARGAPTDVCARFAGTGGKRAGGACVATGNRPKGTNSMRIPLSILDLAPISRGETAGSSIAASVALAQRAEEAGYARVWYAEHHNMPSIASSATSVLIAHVGAHTSTIRLGAGGVMLPNHAPLTIAEQFGTLDAMYP